MQDEWAGGIYAAKWFWNTVTRSNIAVVYIDQRLDLCKANSEDQEVVRGQIVVSLLSRDGGGTAAGHNAVVDALGDLSCPEDLPVGWEEKRTSAGRLFYVNHHTKTSQWVRPTRYSYQQYRSIFVANL